MAAQEFNLVTLDYNWCRKYIELLDSMRHFLLRVRLLHLLKEDVSVCIRRGLLGSIVVAKLQYSSFTLQLKSEANRIIIAYLLYFF